jgi:hypothetical protein
VRFLAGIDAVYEEARWKDWVDGVKRANVLGELAPASRTLTQRQVIGTMFGFLSNNSQGRCRRTCFTRRCPDTLSNPPKSNAKSLARCLGFYPGTWHNRAVRGALLPFSSSYRSNSARLPGNQRSCLVNADHRARHGGGPHIQSWGGIEFVFHFIAPVGTIPLIFHASSELRFTKESPLCILAGYETPVYCQSCIDVSRLFLGSRDIARLVDCKPAVTPREEGMGSRPVPSDRSCRGRPIERYCRRAEMLAQNLFEFSGPHVAFAFDDLRRVAADYSSHGLICTTFVRSEFSPPPEEFNQTQREYDKSCEWFKQTASEAIRSDSVARNTCWVGLASPALVSCNQRTPLSGAQSHVLRTKEDQRPT